MADIFMSHEDNVGYHNSGNVEYKMRRTETLEEYQDLSTIIVVPTRGGASISSRWISCYQDLIKPVNQKILGPMFAVGLEVGAAYN